jgi:fluoride exporter
MSNLFFSYSFFTVAFFGAVGVTLRFWLDQILLSKGSHFWLSTLLINIVGSFMLGFFAELSQLRSPLALTLKTGLIIGLCGGFTTFSALSMNMLRLLEEGNILGSMTYGIGSLLMGVYAVYLGMCLGRVV